MRRVPTCLALLACLHAGAAANPPPTPSLSAHHSPSREGVEGGLWMAAEDYERVIAQSPRRIADPALEAYLHDIVCRLAPDYCADIRLYVMRTPYFNASMMPNGAMQVWTGLLIRVRNEAQLAAVLGHELGHYLRQHGLQQMEDLRRKGNLLTLFTLGLGAAVVGGGVGAGTAEAASLGAQLGMLGSLFAFSREHETEADRYGLHLIARAGYDPDEAPTVWQNLIDEDRADDGEAEERSAFFATHPAPDERMAGMRADSARETAARTITADEARRRHLDAVRPHLATWFGDEIALHQPRKSEWLFRRLLDAGFVPGVVNYQLGEVARLKDTSTLSRAALDHYETALMYPDAPAETHRAIGLWKLKAKELPEAREHLTAYLEAAPGAGDRAMIEYYLSLTGTAP